MQDVSKGEGAEEGAGEGRPPGRLGWKTPLVVLLLYGLAIAIATYPRISLMGDTLPGTRVDPLNHICVMKWYKACLLEGKSYVHNPGLQYPVGFPMALNSPMILQASLFLPLSLASVDDYLCYNILWFIGFLFSGLSVFVLGWSVLRDRFAAGFAGLVGMISTPIMMRGHGHLELMYAGSMALFLAAWINWVDRPGRKGLLLAASSYLLAALCAAYFALLPIVPAVIYVAWRMIAAGGLRDGGRRWLASRLGGFAAFVALTVPGLLLIFSSQFWASTRGISMDRPLSAFARFGTPIWAYLIPTTHHAAYAAYPVGSLGPLGLFEGECGAYLGVVPLLLIGYAAARRAAFPRAGFWWVAFATAVVLSMGACLEIGPNRIPMPALWLRQTVPLFKSLRAPSRFNLLACVVAALIAAAGLRRLMSGFRSPWTRGVIGSVAVALVLADLSMTPFMTDPNRPPMPGCYDWIRARNPKAAILEAPLVSSGCPHTLTETCAYWQSTHGLKTTAGYSSFVNTEFDDLMVGHSPFFAETLFNPTALDHPDSLAIGIVADVSVKDYAWLVARRARFDYFVLHAWDETAGIRSPTFFKLAEAIQEALVMTDSRALVYDAGRLTKPTRPVLLCDKGLRCWRGKPGPPMRVMGRTGQITAFVPDGSGKLVFSFKTRAFRRPRMVILRAGDAELARWDVGTSDYKTLETPPLSLPSGLQTLTLESDGEDAAVGPDEEPCEWDNRPYGLQILEIRLKPPTKSE